MASHWVSFKQIRMPWDVPPLFQTNLAKTGMLWPKGHPYFKDITSRELGRALEYIDPDSVYYDVETEAGNTIEVSYLHKKQNWIKISKLLTFFYLQDNSKARSCSLIFTKRSKRPKGDSSQPTKCPQIISELPTLC